MAKVADDLSYFCALADCENLTSAARMLQIAPSTLSRSLVRIERKVGVLLFDRTGKGLVLNEYGRLYHAAVQRSLSELEIAQTRITDLTHPDRGEIRIAFLESLGPWLVETLIGPYRQKAPGIKFWTRARTSTHALRYELESARVQFIITAANPRGSNMSWQVLRRERLYLVVGLHHRLATRSLVSLNEVASEEFVLGAHDSILGQPIRDLCDRAGIELNITTDISDSATSRSLVAAGFGVSILSKTHDDSEPDNLSYIELREDGAFRDLGVAWTTDGYLPPSSAKFHKFLLSRADKV